MDEVSQRAFYKLRYETDEVVDSHETSDEATEAVPAVSETSTEELKSDDFSNLQKLLRSQLRTTRTNCRDSFKTITEEPANAASETVGGSFSTSLKRLRC